VADWVLIPCLKALFAEFDRIAPSRDHASDGSIGNEAHEREVSDHNPDETGSVPIHDADHANEVHAIDVDNNLRDNNAIQWRVGSTTYYGMEAVVQFLIGRCRSGTEKRLRYIIYNRRIWSASSGWVQKTYTGASPHTEHAHLSGSYESSLEASTASWHLEDIPVALTAADKTWINSTIAAHTAAAVNGLIDQTTLMGADGKPDGTTSTPVGHNTFNQGLPSPFEADGGRVRAYTLLGQMASAIKDIQARVGEESA
jgi:hypothetical protein